MSSSSSKALSAGAVIESDVRSYRVERVLGAGGFGITYMASAAVKLGNVTVRVNFAVKEHFLGELCERDAATSRVVYSNPVSERVAASQKDFVSEARRLHKVGIEHPNIVKVNEVFEANNTAYYVMEYLDGESLRSYVRRHGALSEDEMMQIMRPVIDAVGYLHRNRMTHLDVKPDNIMLTKDDDGHMRPVLIDFGLSKHYGTDGRPTSTINTLGCSDGYAPMEQYMGITTFSPTADIYALGATMLFCLTGRDPKKASELRPGDLDGILSGLSLTASTRSAIARAMATSQFDRTQSVDAMFNDPAVGAGRALPANGGTPTACLNQEQRSGDFCGQRAGHGAAPTASDKPTRPVTASSTTSRRPLIIGVAAAIVILVGILLIPRNGSSDDTMTTIVADSTTIAVDSLQPVGGGHIQPAPIAAEELTTSANSIYEIINGLRVNIPDTISISQTEVLRNLINNMVYVAGGTFTMGATSEQGSDVDNDVKPAHNVTLSDYRIGRYEVTQKEWKAVMDSNPSKRKGDNLPVENVSYNDCKDFISRLNDMTGLHFRLPTEAQWEYAARGGSHSKGYKYSGGNDISLVAWYYDNSDSKIHQVGTKQPNELGLYDMSGNVWEWCNDWKGDYSSFSQTNPSGVSSSSKRVYRGGSWGNSARSCCVSFRSGYSPGSGFDNLGLRLAL